jgi:hypothetical protein
MRRFAHLLIRLRTPCQKAFAAALPRHFAALEAAELDRFIVERLGPSLMHINVEGHGSG